MYQDRIFTFAHYYLGHREEAEDATQEVLIRLWRNRSEIDPARIEPWLITVTRNACFDALRKRKNYRSRVTSADFDDPALGHLLKHEETPQSHTESAEFQHRLEQAISKIREPYRSILILREIQDQKYDRISEVLDLPLNTVKGYLHRGRKMLREQLKPWVKNGTPE